MIQAVIGLGFGDCGKGQTVSRLCQWESPLYTLVVRFNGGQQASHTVIHRGKKHAFSNFGSGTMQGFATYWSKFCTVDPVGIMNESQDLLKKGIYPRLYIDAKCPVTTPYEKVINQNTVNYLNHGTVGVGFGATAEREENHYSLLFEDLFFESVMKEKIALLEHHYLCAMNLHDFYKSIDFIKENIGKYFLMAEGLPVYENYICEGAQGLLLDQKHGFFPHVTRSHTDSTNIQELFPGEEVEFYLVTRAYQTRHGRGPMTNENIPHNIKLSKNETNVFNNYQKEFRYSLLDIDLLQYALSKDKFIKKSKKKFVITCLNAVENEYRFTYKGKIINCNNRQDFIERVVSYLK